MGRYFFILFEFLKNNAIREMEYRANFLFLLLVDGFWVFFGVFVVTVMFQYTNSILGWSEYEVLFLIGFIRVVQGFMDTFVRRNLMRFPGAVTRGDLDLVLTKPLNSLFLVSTRYHNLTDFGSTIGGLIVLIYAATKLGISSSPEVFILLFLSSISSFIVFYSLILGFAIFGIFIPRLTALGAYYDLLNNLARFPGEVFSGGKLAYEVLLLPVLLISTLPVRIILEKAPVYYLAIELIGVLVLFLAVNKFWNFALKHYSSASS